jgi:hypothetical protein
MKVDFLIAEEIRPEVGNKLTVLGLFPGNIIVILKRELPKDTLPKGVSAGLDRLSILATISGASDGLHKFKGRIVEPTGDLYQPEAVFGEANTKLGFAHTVIIELKPFVIKQMGVYRFEFFVDDEKFVYEFEIREQLLQAS